MNVHFLSWNWVRRDAISVVWASINHKMYNNHCLFVFIQMPSEKAGLEEVTTSEKYSIPELQQNTTGSSLCQQATSHLPLVYNCKSNMRLLTLPSGSRINTDIGHVLIFGSRILELRSRHWDFVFLRRFERCQIFHLWETKTLQLWFPKETRPGVNCSIVHYIHFVFSLSKRRNVSRKITHSALGLRFSTKTWNTWNCALCANGYIYPYDICWCVLHISRILASVLTPER